MQATILCECCQENAASQEALDHGCELCDECATGGSCCDCGCAIEDSELRVWERGQRCESCQADEGRHQWLDDTCQAVEALAAEHGWAADDWSVAQTGSRHTTLTRGEECVKVRVSDHATAYCSEDISLAKEGSGDDHTLADLAEALR